MLSNPFGVKESRRRGVSVLEVLIAIGVASVGLLGVILLIPLADHQMNEGAKLERANQLGANAFREFNIRGMNNPAYWIQYTGGNPPLISTLTTLNLFASDGYAPNGPNDYRRAFCIDPRFVTVNQAATVQNGANQVIANAIHFPYVVDPNLSLLTMPRVTLRASPAAGHLVQMGDVNADGIPESHLQADAVFIALDDLEFRRPTSDRTLPPVQLNNAGGANDDDGDLDIDGDWNPLETNPNPSERARKAFGRLSWMAMLVPNEKLGANGDEYVLSVVVFYDRDPSFAMEPPANESANERVAKILGGDPNVTYNGFFAGGVGGGTVALMPRNPGLTQAKAATELEVRAGDWVMLSRTNEYTLRFANGSPVLDNNGNEIELEGPQSHRWYRVLAADSGLSQEDTDQDGTPDEWAHFITLEGPDWPIDQNTQVTLVKDVIAVFEKTVRLDASSLWTN